MAIRQDADCTRLSPIAHAPRAFPKVARLVAVTVALAVAGAIGAASAAAAPSVLAPDPAAIAFADHDVHDGNRESIAVTFTNGSGTDATVSAVGVGGADAAQFTLGPDGCSGAVVGGSDGTCQVWVQFAPSSPGVKSATLELTDDTGTSEVTLAGTGTTGTLSANPISFQPQPSFYGDPQAQLNLFNSSPWQVQSTSWSFTGPDAARFYVQYGDNCLHQTFFPGNSCTTGIAMRAAPPGTYTAQLEIANDGTASPLVIPLSVVELRGPHISAPAQVAFGDVVIGQDATRTVTVVNDGDTPMQLQQVFVATGRTDVFYLTDEGCSPAPVAAGGSCQVVVHFRPSFAGPLDGPIFFILGNASVPVSVVGVTGNGVAPTGNPGPTTSGPTAIQRRSVRLVGRAALGRTLRCRPLGFAKGTTFRYKWLRGGRTVARAVSGTYRVRRDDIGARFKCRVSATNDAGTTQLSSPTSARVKAVVRRESPRGDSNP